MRRLKAAYEGQLHTR